jgi:hypothetical protein
MSSKLLSAGVLINTYNNTISRVINDSLFHNQRTM